MNIFISQVMMIVLCVTAAFNTFKSAYSWNFARLNGICKLSPGFIYLKITFIMIFKKRPFYLTNIVRMIFRPFNTPKYVLGFISFIIIIIRFFSGIWVHLNRFKANLSVTRFASSRVSIFSTRTFYKYFYLKSLITNGAYFHS